MVPSHSRTQIKVKGYTGYLLVQAIPIDYCIIACQWVYIVLVFRLNKGFFSSFLYFIQWLTAQIQVFLPTPSGRVRLNMGTSHSAAWCSMTVTLDITSLVHRCSAANQWATGTNLFQSALVR